MGESMNITRKVMHSMIKEIDVNGDGTIELDEWIEYIRKSKNTNKLDVRGQDNNNILLDLIDYNKGEEKTRKKNLNIHDNYKINEIELQDAIKIAKKEEIKIRKLESSTFNSLAQK